MFMYVNKYVFNQDKQSFKHNLVSYVGTKKKQVCRIKKLLESLQYMQSHTSFD